MCNPLTPVQSKHTFSFSRSGRKSDPKSVPKAPPNRPKSIEKRLSSPCKNSCRKSCHTKCKKCEKYRKRVLQKDQKNVTAAFVLGPFLVPASMDREKRPQVTKMREKGWPKAVKRYKKRTAGRGNELPETCRGTARKLPGHNWRRLAISGDIWPCLAASGHTWPQLSVARPRCLTTEPDIAEQDIRISSLPRRIPPGRPKAQKSRLP